MPSPRFWRSPTKLRAIVSRKRSTLPGKVARGKAVDALQDEVAKVVEERFPGTESFEISQAFDYIKKKTFRASVLDKGTRCDGRRPDDIRPLSGEAGILPRSHGSAIFARGETQAMALATLAPIDEGQMLDSYTGGPDHKRFLLHYNFPPFSVGETGRMGGINRREIGHGALAERSVEAVLPDDETFPYAIRVSSEVMESNGSTSMATVCSASMALLDAGGAPDTSGRGYLRRPGFRVRRRWNDGAFTIPFSTSSGAKTSSVTWTSSSVGPPKG